MDKELKTSIDTLTKSVGNLTGKTEELLEAIADNFGSSFGDKTLKEEIYELREAIKKLSK